MAIEAYNRGLGTYMCLGAPPNHTLHDVAPFKEANRHDFRAYYGLGHTYEILKMPYFALHYYKQAFKLK